MGRGDARNAEPRQSRDTHRTTPRLWTHTSWTPFRESTVALLAVAGPKEASRKRVPDYVHFPAFWCSLILEAITLSQGASARCRFWQRRAKV